jgi:hypothetical protein
VSQRTFLLKKESFTKEKSEEKSERMSFIFPKVFYNLLLGLRERYRKDMTYIVMEAVNDWVIKKENLTVDENSGIPYDDDNNGKLLFGEEKFKRGKL